MAMARWNILLCGANACCKASDDASAATDGPAAEQASSSDPQDFSLAGEASNLSEMSTGVNDCKCVLLRFAGLAGGVQDQPEQLRVRLESIKNPVHLFGV